METVIFIKTYPKDKEYLQWCLKSIKKFVSGYSYICLITDKKFEIDYLGLPIDFIEIPKLIPNGYDNQQIIKLSCFEFLSSSVDRAVMVDSDYCFSAPFNCSTVENIWYYRNWIELGDDQHICWKEAMDKIYQQESFDTMTGPLFIYTKDLYHSLKRMVGNFKDFYLNHARLSEYELMGNYLKLVDNLGYQLIHSNYHSFPVKQFWSHADIESNLTEIKKLLE